MEKLNKIMTIVVGAVVVLAILLSGGRQPEPVNDPWFRQAVLESSTPVVVKFGADWCGPCRGMDAAMDTLQPQYASRAKFLKIDIDKTPNLFAHYGSGSGIPQIMIFREGRVVAQQKGFGGEDGLKHWLEDSL
jgi:thioredoxin-like negative regulator of GroEL